MVDRWIQALLNYGQIYNRCNLYTYFYLFLIVAARFLATFARAFRRSAGRRVFAGAVFAGIGAAATTAAGRRLLCVGQAFLPVLNQRLGQTNHVVVLAALSQFVHSHADASLGENVQVNVLLLQFLEQVERLFLTLYGLNDIYIYSRLCGVS